MFLIADWNVNPVQNWLLYLNEWGYVWPAWIEILYRRSSLIIAKTSYTHHTSKFGISFPLRLERARVRRFEKPNFDKQRVYQASFQSSI
jgi:hypothetical protein